MKAHVGKQTGRNMDKHASEGTERDWEAQTESLYGVSDDERGTDQPARV